MVTLPLLTWCLCPGPSLCCVSLGIRRGRQLSSKVPTLGLYTNVTAPRLLQLIAFFIFFYEQTAASVDPLESLIRVIIPAAGKRRQNILSNVQQVRCTLSYLSYPWS